MIKARTRQRGLGLGKERRPKKRFWGLGLIVIMGGLWWGYRNIQTYFLRPEAIFVLGGHEDRERFAAKLALLHPNLPIWVSSGSPKDYTRKIFDKTGVKLGRLHLDYSATDTVTNFTTLVDRLKSEGIHSVYLVTSDSHMRRAQIVGEIVFGSRGIIIKPISIPSDLPPEPLQKSLRDGARALLWVLTGNTGEKWVLHSPGHLSRK
ncbi:MAG: YdcF family protein [Chlorogloea purpurea SAG 13.99]|nr:YdcF family protein [Chlorogloea purpurea SAG 13.99]